MTEGARHRYQDVASRDQGSAPLDSLDRVLFTLAVIAQLGLIWAFPYPPTQDGGVHLANAATLLNYHAPGAELLRASFDVQPAPSFFTPVVLACLMAAMSPENAERVLVSLFIILFAHALRHATGAVRPAGRALASIGLPIALGYFLHLGFYSFCFGMVAFLAVVTMWIRNPTPGLLRTMVWAVLAIASWIAHPMAAAAAAGSIGIAAAVCALRTYRESITHRISRALRFLLPLVAFAPLVPLNLWVRSLQGESIAIYPSFAHRFLILFTLDGVSAFSRRELLVSVPVAMLVGLATAFGALRQRSVGKKFVPADALLYSAAALVALAFVVPNDFMKPSGIPAGGWIIHRLAIFVPLLLLTWAGTKPIDPRWMRRFSAVATAIVGLQIALHAGTYRAYHDIVADLVEIETALPEEASYLFLSRFPQGSPDRSISEKIDVLEHAGSRFATNGTRIDLSNFAASTHGLFPVVFRPEVDLAVSLPDGIAGDIAAYERHAPEISFLMVWGCPGIATATDLPASPLVDDIARWFEPSTVSLHGWACLYRRLGSPSVASDPPAPRRSTAAKGMSTASGAE